MKEQLIKLGASYIVGIMAYLLAMLWIGWGNAEPTPETSGIGWALNGVGLAFWVLAYLFIQPDMD